MRMSLELNCLTSFRMLMFKRVEFEARQPGLQQLCSLPWMSYSTILLSSALIYKMRADIYLIKLLERLNELIDIGEVDVGSSARSY